MDITPDLPALDDQTKWIDDPRNRTWWNLRGKVFREWPISDNEVVLVDVNTGGEVRLTNAEVTFEEKIGNLVEVDPYKSQALILGTGGTTGAKKSTPEGQNSLKGKYAVGVMKRLLEQGKKVVPPKEEEEEVPEIKFTKPASSVVGKYAKRTE